MYTLNIVCMALAYALQPIAAYNEGRATIAGLRTCSLSRLGWRSSASVSFHALRMRSRPRCACCSPAGDAELAASSAGHVKIVLMFCAFGFLGQIMSAYFESIGGTKRAVMFGVLRYAVFAVPAILVISACSGIENVWWALPAADLATFALSVVMAGRSAVGCSRAPLRACAARRRSGSCCSARMGSLLAGSAARRLESVRRGIAGRRAADRRPRLSDGDAKGAGRILSPPK